MLLSADYLTLKLIRLQPPEEWSADAPALCFLFPKQGVGEYVSGEVTWRLLPGDVVAHNRSMLAQIRALNGDELAIQHFSASLENLIGLFATKEISLLHGLSEGLRASRHYPASSALARECHRLLERAPAQLTLEHRCHLLKIAAAILSTEFKNLSLAKMGAVEGNHHFTQMLEQLSPTEIVGFPMDDLARKFGCSRRHLNRLFHQNFGTSVGALKMEMRLLKAVALLQDPAAKVINVAAECGFNHLGLFNTCFKKRFGASPGRWRKVTLRIEVHPANPNLADPACPIRKSGLCPWADSRHPVRPLVLAKATAGPPPRVLVPST